MKLLISMTREEVYEAILFALQSKMPTVRLEVYNIDLSEWHNEEAVAKVSAEISSLTSPTPPIPKEPLQTDDIPF